MTTTSTENEVRRVSAYEVALEVRHSSEGLQLQKYLFGDGLQVVQDQSDLETVPIEHLRPQPPPEILYGGEKEVNVEEKELAPSTELPSSKPGSLRSAKMKSLSVLACILLFLVIAAAVTVTETMKASTSQRSALSFWYKI